MSTALVVVAICIAVPVYAYVLYPALLWAVGRFRSPPVRPRPEEWPRLSISVPVYNEAAQVEELMQSLLALDYPRDRLQILLVSDASTDGTDEIVKSYADRGIEFMRLPERRGKTAAENAARSRLTGDIVLNTDASIRIPPTSVKRLVAWFQDPSVGLASGRDVSVSGTTGANVGEGGYVGYEMKIRELETRVSGIVGASGCYYAIRAPLHDELVPEALSRDFASAMITREHGYRAVSVSDAICYVPRTSDLRKEYRRKVRTMTRGMETLFFKRHLLNPLRHGAFSWMLFSHKICRWLVPWAGVVAAGALAVWGLSYPPALVALGLGLLLLAPTMLAWWWPRDRTVPRILALPAFAVLGNVAALHASINALRGELNPIWEPTRRGTTSTR